MFLGRGIDASSTSSGIRNDGIGRYDVGFCVVVGFQQLV